MRIYFVTKRDINGNTYVMGVDTNRKVYSNELSMFDVDDKIVTNKKTMNEVASKCDEDNYTKVGIEEWRRCI